MPTRLINGKVAIGRFKTVAKRGAASAAASRAV
jgi:hypothetical protein